MAPCPRPSRVADLSLCRSRFAVVDMPFSSATGASWAMLSDAAIQCRGLGKAYQLYARRTDQVKQMLFGSFHRFYLEYWVLRDIDLEMQRGESIGIIGRNGAGKTTLLRLLCGITQPTRGEISVAGRTARILALGAGFDWELTGRQNVLISGAVLGLRRSD